MFGAAMALSGAPPLPRLGTGQNLKWSPDASLSSTFPGLVIATYVAGHQLQ